MDGVTAPALVWAWANHGRRWHLRDGGPDALALCGAGKRGWKHAGEPFDPDYIDVLVCVPCLSVRKRGCAPASRGAAGDGAP